MTICGVEFDARIVEITMFVRLIVRTKSKKKTATVKKQTIISKALTVLHYTVEPLSYKYTSFVLF